MHGPKIFFAGCRSGVGAFVSAERGARRRRRKTRGVPMTDILLTGLAIGESPRWHDGRLWFCNWGTQEVVAVDERGKRELITHVPTDMPASIDWLPDGRLLLVSGREALLLRQEPDGTLVTHAD